MLLSEYVLLPEAERLSHIDLSEPCAVVTRGRWNWFSQSRKLLEWLGVTDDIGNFTQAHINHRHMCPCNTRNGHICINPKHIALGTALENNRDIDPEVKSESSRKAYNAGLGLLSPEELRQNGAKASKSFRSKASPEKVKEVNERAAATNRATQGRPLAVTLNNKTSYYRSREHALEREDITYGTLGRMLKDGRSSPLGHTARLLSTNECLLLGLKTIEQVIKE